MELRVGIFAGYVSTNPGQQVVFENITVSGDIEIESTDGFNNVGGMIGYGDGVKATDCKAENISVTGVPDGMEAEITSTAEEYNITVSGLSRDVSILHDSSVTGILNLTQWMEDNGVEELTPGTYTIPVTFNLAEDITVTPDINIHIRLKNADTDNQ